MSDNTKKAQCIHCLHFFLTDSNSTLKNHIIHPHCEALKRVAESGQSSMSRDGSIFVYNPDVLREQFAGLVIQRGLPFNHFDDEQTMRVFQKHLQPRYAHLENKIMSITLDNASNNTSAISKLRLKYEPPIEGRFYHSRCVAHIINLCVQDGLAVKDINTIKESFKTMLKDVFKSGGKNQQRYSKICKQAGKPCLSPHWDVPTRWNSTYHMFLSGLKQKSTLMYFHDLLASKNRCHQFPAENWVIIEGLTQLLEVFNNATKVLSGVYYSTSPLKAEETMFPILSRMAMDILSIQATSVASESAFSTNHLDAQERKQDKSTLETPVDFEEEILDAEVQANDVIPLSDKEIALDATSSEGSMSEPGSGREEVEAEANYGYGVYHDDY
ncbi:zinc finger BED domain-containing protein RICESLEEPER 2-like protein [Tanacetum coccineum]